MAGGIVDMLAVGSGSFLGGVARYAVGRVLQTHATGSFPWGTLAVNIGGCLLIGILYGLIDKGMPGVGQCAPVPDGRLLRRLHHLFHLHA